ncbi:MAG: sensor histidine kinase [Flavobacteriales bacterium]|nr:sensor histidine kinase [Flavobacteriales bacterium]MCB0817168.1 sensor histidine kinase [Flavobacteriales bacterium]MCB9199268.1 sensor histidine kinase [Flavobacteriales bacterium]HOP44078.1 sensor histidine kinase [Flavobacteriales bacterium]HPJ52431.1 sensor histidine kinase [Flavobacteriales bacterium]
MIPFLRTLALLLLLVQGIPALASRQLDKERVDIEGMATNAVRAKALLELATSHAEKDVNLSLMHAHDALGLARLSGNDELVHDALTLIAKAQLELGLHAEYMKSTLEALEISRARQDAVSMAADLRALALAYRHSLRPDRAIQESRNALAILLQTKDTVAIDMAYRGLVEELILGGAHQEALRICDQALDRARERNDMLAQARLWLLVGEAMSHQRKFGNALPYLVRADRVLDSLGNREDRFRAAVGRARAALGMGMAEEAASWVDRAERTAASGNPARSAEVLSELRYRVALARGDQATALALLQGIQAARDSMYNARSAQQIAGLQTMYELEVKEQANRRLQEKNDLNEERITAQNARSELLLTLLAVASVLVLVLGASFWNNYRVVRRLRLKNQVIRRQSDEIHAKNMELERNNLRLAESIVSEEQKELQLKEIHHRVKNNLQIVNTLLRLQGMHASSMDTADLLEEAQNRIRSMALVHEHMYRSGDLREVDARTFIEVLVGSVLNSFGLEDRIRALVQADRTEFSMDTLVPLSLLINELITNSAKHAFHGRKEGFLSIQLKRAGRGFELLYQDDGPGLQQERFFQERSFGNQLVQSLAEQLNGQVGLERADHTRVVLRFVPDEQERTALRTAS